MSKISDAYDELLSELATLYPDKTRLANPYSIDNNTVESKNDGFGVRIGAAVNTNRQLACKMSLNRAMTVIITRRIAASELRPDDIDTAYKDILEEHFSLISKFEVDPRLDTASVFKFVYGTDNGIELLVDDENKWVKIETVFEMEYFEDLN